MYTPETVTVKRQSFPLHNYQVTASKLDTDTGDTSRWADCDFITTLSPEGYKVGVVVDSAARFNADQVTYGVVSQEKYLGDMRLVFNSHTGCYTDVAVSNFILENSTLERDSVIGGINNIVRGSARVINSSLWRENLIEGNSILVAAHAVFSKMTDSAFFGGGHLTDSKLSGNVFTVNANINHSDLGGNIEINAENLDGERLGVHALRIPKWLIPGNSEPISVTNKVDFSDLSLATRAFHVYDGDLWQALPNVRLCFNPAEHKEKVEHCHCLLWLPLMLTFSPAALHYLMRVSDLEKPLGGVFDAKLSRKEAEHMRDVCVSVRDMTSNNPLASLPMRTLEELLMRELKELEALNGSRPDWCEKMWVNLESLGVTKQEMDKLIHWDWNGRSDHFNFARMFARLTGIPLGSKPVKK